MLLYVPAHFFLLLDAWRGVLHPRVRIKGLKMTDLVDNLKKESEISTFFPIGRDRLPPIHSGLRICPQNEAIIGLYKNIFEQTVNQIFVDFNPLY